MKIRLKAYAKINLSLNITGVREESVHMHTLDTVLTSVDLADVITVSKRKDSKVNIEYSDNRIEAGKDSVTKAVCAFQKKYGAAGADIFIEKRIPFCGGLGGSGADAAGVLNALAALYNINDNLTDIAFSAGSDVPYLLRGGFCRVSGTGGQTDFFTAPAEFYPVIAQAAGGVLAKDAYRVFDGLYPEKKYCPSDNDALIAALAGNDSDASYGYMRNALTKPSLQLSPRIADTLAALTRAGAVKSLMAGSGSACVGFFPGPDKAETAARDLREKGFYAKAVKTLRKGIEIT